MATQVVATRTPVSAVRTEMRLLACVHAPMLYQLEMVISELQLIFQLVACETIAHLWCAFRVCNVV